MLSVLRGLPQLQRLEFRYEAREGLSASAITALVAGSTRLPSLKVLILDHIKFEQGANAWEVRPYKSTSFFSSWVAPDWPDDFTEEEMRRLVDASEGVRIDGQAVEALEWQEEYEEQKEEFEASQEAYWREEQQGSRDDEEEYYL